MLLRLTSLLTCFFILNFAQAQDLCAVVGWATQNGGTTGGGAAVPITVTNITDLQNQAKSVGSKVIYVSGTMGAGVATRVSVAANKTIIGLPGAKLYGGFDVKANNVIIRNMIVQGPGSVDVNGVDCITIDKANNVWIDHCTIYDGQDGNMDITNGASFVSVTWCKFYYTAASVNHQFNTLIGNSDTKTTDRGKLKVTMMYNYWAAGCKERMPRVRFGQVHVVNNYFGSTGNSHCVRAGIEADLLVEGNFFENVSTPIDFFENNFTAITSRNNTYVNTTGNSTGSGTAFTPPYSLNMAASADVKALVLPAAGATMPSPTQCSGVAPVLYAINGTANPATAGTVTGSGSYAAGSTITLSAIAASGYAFNGWSGDTVTNTNPLSFSVYGAKNLTANFVAVAVNYSLSTTASPTAGGTVTGAGSYASGSVVTLTASPANGYSFSGWGGDATGTGLTTTVTMNANKSVIANFKANTVNYVVSTLASPVAGGTVTGAGSYAAGTSATLTATPAAGYVFSGWSGAATGTTNPVVITVNGNVAVTANFTLSGGTGTTTLRIEDNATTTSGLCLVEGAISSNSGAANGKVVNLTNSTGKGVNWRVNVPAAGTYTLNWRYVNSSTSNTYTMSYYLNGVLVNAALPFPKTSSSTVFANTTITATLRAGNNDIRLQSIANNATADIDWIEITGNAPTAGNCAAARPSAEAMVGKIGIYPNPAKNNARLVFNNPISGEVSIQILNANGKIVTTARRQYFQAGIQQQAISLPNLAAGFYWVQVQSADGNKAFFKLMIQ